MYFSVGVQKSSCRVWQPILTSLGVKKQDVLTLKLNIDPRFASVIFLLQGPINLDIWQKIGIEKQFQA